MMTQMSRLTQLHELVIVVDEQFPVEKETLIFPCAVVCSECVLESKFPFP